MAVLNKFIANDLLATLCEGIGYSIGLHVGIEGQFFLVEARVLIVARSTAYYAFL